VDEKEEKLYKYRVQLPQTLISVFVLVTYYLVEQFIGIYPGRFRGKHPREKKKGTKYNDNITI
jgi:hypothetical protein